MTVARAVAGSLRVAALLSLACALPVHAQLVPLAPDPAPAFPCPSPLPLPRVFGGVRMGPIGESTVRAQARELAAAPVPEPALFTRLDVSVHPSWRIGLDLALFPGSDQPLRPYGRNDGVAEIYGILTDLVLAVRPGVWLEPGRVQLEFSFGAGLSMRPSMGGTFPLTSIDGSTELAWLGEGFDGIFAWGVLAQVGVGTSVWLSRRFVALIELQALARQTNAVVADRKRGDYLLQTNDLHVLLAIGFGATLGAL